MSKAFASLVVNTNSRNGRKTGYHAKKILESNGIQLAGELFTHEILKIEEFIIQEINNKRSFIIVGGGDGTVCKIAKFFLESKTVLGVLPLGTGNAFARDLSIPEELEMACKTLAMGVTQQVDVGKINQDFFLNVTTIGLTSLISRYLKYANKPFWGKWSYLHALTKALAFVRPFHVTIKTELEALEFEILQIVIGNGRYHAGPLLITPSASIVDGKLSIYALIGNNRIDFLRFGLALLRGDHTKLANVYQAEVGSVEIVSLTPQRVICDGEIYGKTPIFLGCKPKGINVIVGPEFHSSI